MRSKRHYLAFWKTKVHAFENYYTWIQVKCLVFCFQTITFTDWFTVRWINFPRDLLFLHCIFLPNFHDRDLKMILKICGVCRTVLDFSFNRTITWPSRCHCNKHGVNVVKKNHSICPSILTNHSKIHSNLYQTRPKKNLSRS